MDHLFVGYLKDPTPENFLKLRSALLETPGFDPYSRDLARADQLFAANHLEEAEQELRQRMRPGHILSPGSHLKLALVYQRLGRTEEMDRERAIAIRCAEGILSTGDGSQERPYLVTRNSDEHDVLAVLGWTWKSQTLKRQAERRLDVVQSVEGPEVWFDVTEIFELLRRKLKQG